MQSTDRSQIKWISDFIWNIADDRLCDVYERGWQPGPDDVEDDAALVALGDDAGDVTQKEDGDGEES
ncbi:hypothetical protein [Zoogloea sp.]|uniref:hypothetical protein n=1 Tax=Zoogloea sp. TaxID=49181 RepID=UPI001ACA07BB|nr:hypothetical protein [Zoogloea sp.]MBN8284969.1 hypothetical protein [Zoogloea sp.]